MSLQPNGPSPTTVWWTSRTNWAEEENRSRTEALQTFQGWRFAPGAATLATLIPSEFSEGLEKIKTRIFLEVHGCFSQETEPLSSPRVQLSNSIIRCFVYCAIHWWSSGTPSISTHYQSSVHWMSPERVSRVLSCPNYGLRNGFPVSHVCPQKLQKETTWCPLVVTCICCKGGGKKTHHISRKSTPAF